MIVQRLLSQGWLTGHYLNGIWLNGCAGECGLGLGEWLTKIVTSESE